MLRGLAFVICRIFFRNIHVSGTPYVGKSCIWAANHTSGIVDPIVLFGTAPVKLRPLAKHTLWDHPVMRPLLKVARAIPVHRTQDMKKDLQAQKEAMDRGASEKDWRASSNNDAFKSVADSLIAGDCVLIFPEGVSHDDPYLYKLKTGLARMALQAMTLTTDPHFTTFIQPVAIDYFEKDEFRSDIAFHFCEPIVITTSEMEVADIMLGVDQSLRDALASFKTWDEKRNYQFLFEMAYGRTPHSAREFRIFVDKTRPAFEADPVFLARVQTMRRMLMAMNISPSQLLWGEAHEKKRSFFKLLLTHGWFYWLIAAPIEYLSGMFWYIPYRVCGKLAELSTQDRDVVATMKIAHGLYLFPGWVLLMSLPQVYFWHRIFPHIGLLPTIALGTLLGPLLLVVGTLCAERHDFFPGYWRLAKLRLLFPRGWREVISEWREISQGVAERTQPSPAAEDNNLLAANF